jgi:hypothetical protein
MDVDIWTLQLVVLALSALSSDGTPPPSGWFRAGGPRATVVDSRERAGPV